ncbi:unnamed protein product [Calypogeia fissa]
MAAWGVDVVESKHNGKFIDGINAPQADVENGDNGSEKVMKQLAAAAEDGEVLHKIKLPDAAVPTATKQQRHRQQQSEPAMASFMRLFSFADSCDYALMFFGAVGAAVHGAGFPLVILFFGKLLSGLGGTKDLSTARHTVNEYVLDLVWLGLINIPASWLEISCWTLAGERQVSRMRAKYLQALLRKDVAYFDTDTKTGEFVDSIATDPLMVQEAISEKMGNFIHYLSTLVVGLVIGFTNHWKIAVVTIAVLPLLALAGGLLVYNITRFTAKAASSYTEAGSIAEQAIAQVRTVYSFVGEAKFVRDYSDTLEKSLKLSSRSYLAKGLGMGCIHGIFFACWALLFWYGGVQVRKGQTDGGQALSTIFAVIYASIALGQSVPFLTTLVKGRVAAFKIFQAIDRKSTMIESDEVLESVEGLIELRNVIFSYPSRPHAPIFTNFSLIVPQGKTVAIVGSSGSGKSTIISLIERFYDPVAGEVLLDGHNLKTLNLKWLRGQIGLVNQEPVLFATTIFANILYGKDNATEEEIEEAAKAANAHSFVDQLPFRYQTQVGERGVQLSGGQKQRVAIARAVVKNPKVLLLDEATSSLDAGSEVVVEDALDRLMVGRTTIVVAHRLSTIRNADSIAVVQKGQIVQMGTHQDLMSREDGEYFNLVRLQELAATNEDTIKRSASSMSMSRRISRDGLGSASVLSISSRRSGSSMRSMDSQAKSEVTQQPRMTKQLFFNAPKGSVSRLVAMTKDDWIYGLGGTIGSIGAGCLNPACAFFMGGILIAYYSNNNHRNKFEVAEYSLLFVLLAALSPVIFTLQHYSMGIWSEKLIKHVREKMFATILQNDLGWFDEDENNSGAIAARLASDANNVRAAVGDRIAVIVQNAALLIVSTILALIIQWKMTIVMLCGFPVIAFTTFAEKYFLSGWFGDQAKAYSRATQVAGEAVANIRTVVAFNAEDKVQALFENELNGTAKRSCQRGQIAGLGYGTSQCVLYCAYALGLWFAGYLVTTGEASFGAVMKVFFTFIICAFNTAETIALTPDLAKGGPAIQSVFTVLDRITTIYSDDPEGEIAENIKGDVELKRISFAYPSRQHILVFRNLNLKVRSGRSLALVGASGSGKSSIIALIERFYDPLSGQVLIDGKDIKRYNLKSVRRHIALVQQEPALFATTIYENILHGKDGASEAEVIEASKVANAHHFISSLPDGYKTQVGERGIQLSGGQKQRVAIARAVLKNPAILLLDEATSALDAQSEMVVQEAIDRLMKGRTTIIVTHRLSTIRGANTIAVVEDGAILEKGSHSHLLGLGGAYSRLLNLQNRVPHS